MNTGGSSRNRPTEAARQAARLSAAIAARLGQDVRAARQQRHLTQARLADRVGLHQSQISRIERGHGDSTPLATWVALGLILGRPFAASLSRPLGVPREPVDAGHLAMQEYLIRRARQLDRIATAEVPTTTAPNASVTDVVILDRANRVVILAEAWNTFGDLGAALRTTRRKVADTTDHGAFHDGGAPYRVASVWVVRDSATNQSLISRYPATLRSVFTGSSRGWVRALDLGAPVPGDPGLVWFDNGRSRLREWRARETRVPRDVENRRSAPSMG